jgi:hypothetical protein
MATHFNITGELTQELLSAGDKTRISNIQLTNVCQTSVPRDSIVDLYIEKKLTGKFYLLKQIKIPFGVTLQHEVKGFNNDPNQFGLFIKLHRSDLFTLTGSIDPTASTTVTGVGTAFLTELNIGDEIVVSGEARVVTAIASNISLTVSVATTNTGNDASPDCNPVAPVDVILY